MSEAGHGERLDHPQHGALQKKALPDPRWITTLPSLVPANRSLALREPPRSKRMLTCPFMSGSLASLSLPGDLRLGLGVLNTEQFVEHHVLFWEVTAP